MRVNADGMVLVKPTGFASSPKNPFLMEPMRRAVKQVTGCELADEKLLGGQWVGTLDCSPATPH